MVLVVSAHSSFLGQVMLPQSYLGDSTNSLGTTFSKHQPLVYVQVLRGFDEAEVDSSLVSCA